MTNKPDEPYTNENISSKLEELQNISSQAEWKMNHRQLRKKQRRSFFRHAASVSVSVQALNWRCCLDGCSCLSDVSLLSPAGDGRPARWDEQHRVSLFFTVKMFVRSVSCVHFWLHIHTGARASACSHYIQNICRRFWTKEFKEGFDRKCPLGK